MGKGIDYSMGTANVDHETGIHYGVINQGEVLQMWADESEPNYPRPCEECSGDDCMDCEPIEYTYTDDGYICQQSADDPDIFVIKSPFYTYCQFCSPCAPGAGYLLSPAKDGIKAYCFGHNWFDEGKAPYKVFDVKTNKEVNVNDQE